MPGAHIRKMMRKKMILSQPTLDRTDMPQRHQKQINLLPTKKKKKRAAPAATEQVKAHSTSRHRSG